jgi:hypothetical protein
MNDFQIASVGLIALTLVIIGLGAWGAWYSED